MPLGTLLGAFEASNKIGGLLGSGDFVGDAVPNMLGLFEGCADGVPEGSELGVLLGTGDFVGEAEPFTLGRYDGATLGFSLAKLLGSIDGQTL